MNRKRIHCHSIKITVQLYMYNCVWMYILNATHIIWHQQLLYARFVPHDHARTENSDGGNRRPMTVYLSDYSLRIYRKKKNETSTRNDRMLVMLMLKLSNYVLDGLETITGNTHVVSVHSKCLYMYAFQNFSFFYKKTYTLNILCVIIITQFHN